MDRGKVVGRIEWKDEQEVREEIATAHHSLEVLPYDPALHVGSQVLLVQPQDAVHLCRVQRHNGPLLISRALQSPRYISASCTQTVDTHTHTHAA